MNQLPEDLNKNLLPQSSKRSETTTSKKPKPVLVIWFDAHQIGYWQEGNDDLVAEPVEVFTLGWLLKRSPKGIYLAQSVAEDNHANAIIIPKSMIKKIIPLDVEE